MAARKAESLGYKNVRVFHAGLPAWKKAGNLVVSNTANLQRLNKIDASYILLDLRSKDKIEQAHIPKAVAAPEGDVASLKDQFPTYKKAVIILYNQEGDLAAARAAYKAVAGWGYKQVSVLSGGFNAWKKSGQKVAKGPAAAKIHYVKKLMPGEIELVKFQEILEKKPSDVVVVDVRNPLEFQTGALPGAQNVPLEDLESKLSEISKEKTLVLHCNTGARAEMAHSILKKKGFDSKYFKGIVKIDKEKDSYTVSD